MQEATSKMEILSLLLFMIGYCGISAKNPGTIPPNEDNPKASHVIISHNVKDKSTSTQDILIEQDLPVPTLEIPDSNNIEPNNTLIQKPSNWTELPDLSNILKFHNVTSKISNLHDHKNNRSKFDTSTSKMPHSKLSTIKHFEIKKKGQIPEESSQSNSTKPSKMITVKGSSTSMGSKKSPILKHSENKVISNSPKTTELSSEPDNLQSTNLQNDSDPDITTTTTKVKKSQSKSPAIISKTNTALIEPEIVRAKLIESTENNAELEEKSDHEEMASKTITIEIPPKKSLEVDKTEKLHTQINKDRNLTIKPKSKLPPTNKIRNQTTKITISTTTDSENESESPHPELFTTLPSESEEVSPVWDFSSVHPEKYILSTQKRESTVAPPNQSPEVKHKTSLLGPQKRRPILKSESEEISPVQEFTSVHSDKNTLSTQKVEPTEAPPIQSLEVKPKTSLSSQSKKRPMLKSEKQESSSAKKWEVSSINSLEDDLTSKEFDTHSASNIEDTSINWISSTPLTLDEQASTKWETMSDSQSQDPMSISPFINKLTSTDGKFLEAEWTNASHPDLTILENESDMKEKNSQPIDKSSNLPTELIPSDKSSSKHWPASWNINPSTEWAILDKTVELPKRSENDQPELINIKKNGAKEWINSWSQFPTEVTKPSNFPIPSLQPTDRRTWPTDKPISPIRSPNPLDSQTLPSKEPDKKLWPPQSDTQIWPSPQHSNTQMFSQQPNSQILSFQKEVEQIIKQPNTQTQLLQNRNVQTWPTQNINTQTLPPQNINRQLNAQTSPPQNINTQPWHPQNINSQTWPPQISNEHVPESQNSNIQTWPSQNKFVQTMPIDSSNIQSSSLAPNQQTLTSIPPNIRTQPSMIFKMQTTSPDKPPRLSMPPNMQPSQSIFLKRQASTFLPLQIQEGRSISPSSQTSPPSQSNKQTGPPKAINDDMQSSKQSNLQQWPPKPSLKVVTWPKGSGLSDPWMPITSDVKPSGRQLQN